MSKEKLINAIIKHFKDDYIKEFKKEDLEDTPSFLKKYINVNYYNSKEYKDDINRYQNQFIFNDNEFIYFPENKSYINCMNIEMDIVAEMRRTGKYIEREYICNPAHSEIFFDNGLNIVESIKVIEKETLIELDLNLIKYKVVFSKEGIAKLEKTNETSNANILFDFNNLEIIKNNFTIDLKEYFSDDCYSFWSVLSGFILYKFKDLGYNVLDKIKYLENQYLFNVKNSKEYSINTNCLNNIEALFTFNQYYTRNRLIELFIVEDGKYKDFTRDLLKLSSDNLLKHYGIKVTASNIKNINKDIENLIYINELTKLGFNQREINILLANNSISSSVLESRVFKAYLSKLSKKQILRKLTKNSNTIQIIKDIEMMLSQINQELELNVNISLNNLEREVINIFNVINIEDLTGKITYDLPNIDYSMDEHCLFTSGDYKLMLPLKLELLSTYGVQLENCIGAHGKSFLNSQNYIAVIRKNNKLIGAIKLDRNFENLKEASGINNAKLKGEDRHFIIDFCERNEIHCSNIFNELLNKEYREAI